MTAVMVKVKSDDGRVKMMDVWKLKAINDKPIDADVLRLIEELRQAIKRTAKTDIEWVNIKDRFWDRLPYSPGDGTWKAWVRHAYHTWPRRKPIAESVATVAAH